MYIKVVKKKFVKRSITFFEFGPNPVLQPRSDETEEKTWKTERPREKRQFSEDFGRAQL